MSKTTDMLFTSLDRYQELFTYKQSEADTKFVQRAGKVIRQLRTIAKYSRPNLADATGIDLVVLTAVEAGIGDPKTAKRTLATVRKHFNTAKPPRLKSSKSTTL